MKKEIRLLLALPFLFFACSDEDLKPYRKDWTQNLSTAIGSTYRPLASYALSDFGLTLLGNDNILIHENSEIGRHLIEVNANGTFLQPHKVNFALKGIWSRIDGSLLAFGYYADHFAWSIYDQGTRSLAPPSVILSADVSDPPNARAIYIGDNALYTYNPIISSNPSLQPYLAKWTLGGTRIWRTIIDESLLCTVTNIASINENYVIFVSVTNYQSSYPIWKIGKLSKDGTLLWHKMPNIYGRIFQVIENSVGDIFILNETGVSKHDADGNLLWKSSLTQYQEGISKNPC